VARGGQREGDAVGEQRKRVDDRDPGRGMIPSRTSSYAGRRAAPRIIPYVGHGTLDDTALPTVGATAAVDQS
jgi:hypothetical protein